MTVKGAATRGLFVWPITVIPALSVQPFLIHFGPFLVPSFPPYPVRSAPAGPTFGGRTERRRMNERNEEPTPFPCLFARS